MNSQIEKLISEFLSGNQRIIEYAETLEGDELTDRVAQWLAGGSLNFSEEEYNQIDSYIDRNVLGYRPSPKKVQEMGDRLRWSSSVFALGQSVEYDGVRLSENKAFYAWLEDTEKFEAFLFTDWFIPTIPVARVGSVPNSI